MSLFGLGSRNQKTFRPKKSSPSGSRGAQLKQHIDATLGSGNLREAVRLPPGEDPNEWLAVNTVDFYNQVNILYGTLTEFCTPSKCPTMTAGPKYEYRWADGVKIKKPIEVSASRYVEYLMEWIETQLDDETIFPQRIGICLKNKKMHVYVEIILICYIVLYVGRSSISGKLQRCRSDDLQEAFPGLRAYLPFPFFQKIVTLNEEAHLNTCFKHFVLFSNEFRLIEKEELAPLRDLVESILGA